MTVQSYLNAPKIIEVALDTKSKAIHPGFGFLSENEQFAESCAQNNIVEINLNDIFLFNMHNYIYIIQC